MAGADGRVAGEHVLPAPVAETVRQHDARLAPDGVAHRRRGWIGEQGGGEARDNRDRRASLQRAGECEGVRPARTAEGQRGVLAAQVEVRVRAPRAQRGRRDMQLDPCVGAGAYQFLDVGRARVLEAR